MNEAIVLNAEYAYVIGVLLSVGGVLKHTFPKFPNRFIPLVTFVGGVTSVLLWAGSFNKQTVLAAVVVSLTATGLHSTTKNLIGKDI